jgi:C-terminal processing protease CtpA/Prc
MTSRSRDLVLAVALLAAGNAWSQPASPAMQVYEQLQAMRGPADELVDAGRPGTPQDARAALAELDRALALMDAPLTHDLAEGNVYLRYRRLDILREKAALLERLGDRRGAIAALDDASLMDASDLSKTTPELAPVLADPAASAIRARYAASARLAEAPAFRTRDGAPLSEAERVAGLSRLWSVARQDFAWFEHVPTLDWDRAYLDAIPKVLAAKDTLAYYRELMRFTALLQDGHSNAYPPESLADRVYTRPGLRTGRVEGRVVVTSVVDAALVRANVKPGDEVLAIDGIAVADYAARFVAPYQSASTPQDLELRTFKYMLLAGDARKPVRVTLRDAQGHRRDVTAARSGWQAVPLPPDDTFVLRPDGIAILTATQFENDAASKLLDQHRDELMQAKGFILDLRRNGGGNTDFGLAILSGLSPAPLPAMVPRVRVDNGFTQARGYGVMWQRLPDDPPFSAPGSKFAGPVAVLIGPATFSAAEDTAATFKAMKRGLLVGTPSGGSTGQPLFFDLPGGGKARICVKRDGYPDGSDFVGKGIQPDIVVAPTIASLREGSDPALDKAVAALLAPAH